MHEYSNKPNHDKYVFLAMVLLSILTSYIIDRSLVIVGLKPEQWYWFIRFPNLFIIFGLYFYLFNKYLWKIRVLHTLKLFTIPNLNGTWHGYLKSSHDKFSQQTDVTLTIKQNWRSISFKLRSETSTSKSITAAIQKEEDGEITIIYLYRNEPKASAKETMNIHMGTTSLKLISNDKLEGQYYTGRDRRTYGELILERKR